MEQILGLLVSLGIGGSFVSVLVEVLKKTNFPTERPKLVATVVSLIVVALVALRGGYFDVAHAEVIAGGAIAVTAASISIYEIVIKPIIGYFSK